MEAQADWCSEEGDLGLLLPRFKAFRRLRFGCVRFKVHCLPALNIFTAVFPQWEREGIFPPVGVPASYNRKGTQCNFHAFICLVLPIVDRLQESGLRSRM